MVSTWLFMATLGVGKIDGSRVGLSTIMAVVQGGSMADTRPLDGVACDTD